MAQSQLLVVLLDLQGDRFGAVGELLPDIWQHPGLPHLGLVVVILVAEGQRGDSLSDQVSPVNSGERFCDDRLDTERKRRQRRVLAG